MEGANADSDHSMTWEDFFGSTTDLAPALIGIYDSFLGPSINKKPDKDIETAKDARNNPPLDPPDDKNKSTEVKFNFKEVEENSEVIEEFRETKDPTMLAGSVKLPIATVNKSSLYSLRTKSDVSENQKFDLTCSDSVLDKNKRTFRDKEMAMGALSPNVKRMISSASETATVKLQKKTTNVARASMRHKSNIPLVGATSKISQSGVEILPSVDIYDTPTIKPKLEEKTVPVKPEFKLDSAEATYDVPTNNRPAIYDVPNKTAFESLSLPYIDQSIELSITCNDREFDTKVTDTSPKQAPKVPPRKSSEGSPSKFPKVAGTNSLNRKDFNSKQLLKTGPYPEAIGSTGNLKCSIPEKEVVRLNPPIEVTRPLSMSSIASSSSTSSSGVQNKGGVNSAYLASIESLDDHSDADMTSANGSNNFVNSAGMLNHSISEEGKSEDAASRHQIVEEISGLSQLERVCSEIVQTENVYVEDLRQVVEGYLHVWRRESTFSDEELEELFNNIEDIYNFNRSLCEALNTCQLDATCIARCFVDNTTGFSVYTSYCTGYPRTMARLAALASVETSAREFRERQIELGHLLPLASYLLKPVQRILKYHLLLQNVVKQCASRETEYALLKMTGIAQHIDDMKRRHEHAVRVQEIQSLLYGWNGPDLTTYGELCAEGTFRVFGAKAMRHVFLFDKMLLVTKNREDGVLAYKSHTMCNNMMLVESIAGAPLSFHVIPWDAPRSQLTLQARSPRHKREWTLLLKRVILENYNAVIPSHARQLVMELGQNKTDDDILAEKSHNLITQASMRKQLSAPEYLEKRKIDRERRKSFENGVRGRMKKNRKYAQTNIRAEAQECDCSQVSAEKGIDYTCDNCYIDLCSDCETELNKDQADDKCSCKHENREIAGEKCPECDRSLHYIDSGSGEHLERKPQSCKCSDFNSSQESFGKEFGGSLNKTRGYHSSDNIINYTEKGDGKDDLIVANNSLTNVRNIPKTCLKCAKIKENIVTTDVTLGVRPSRCNDNERRKTDSITRSKSKDDPQRSKLSKIGTWRRKSEPGLQQNMIGIINKKSQDSDSERNEQRGNEKIEFQCRNCGSNKITRKVRAIDGTIISDPELDGQKRGGPFKSNLEIRMYNTKNIPKKISKIKKNRAKGLRLGSDTTAKFYAELSSDVSTENILHISESNDSLNVDKPKEPTTSVPSTISKDESIDEETYRKLIEKTDSFKKNELEKVKYLNKQKVITEGSEVEDKTCEGELKQEDVVESCEEAEQPLEQIISQLLLQNRDFQKLVKKQQQRNSAQRRHQRLMKSHSNPEHVIAGKLDTLKPKYGRQTSENVDSTNVCDDETDKANSEINNAFDEDHIYETLRIENRGDESLHSLDTKSKVIQHIHLNRPKRLPSPPKPPNIIESSKFGPESDYVYLSFDQLSKMKNSEEGIYDVPVKSPQRADQRVSNECYVTMENQTNIPSEINIYDSLLEVCRRKKDVPDSLPTEYLPMSPMDQQSPNTPEIWLSRQKEHFNVSRDRKSGSLPRSFQVVVGQDEDNLSTFKCKPNSNNKTYVNRDGKVKSTDRPYTIASDQSEISYDDVESYMSEGDVLKFNKSTKSETDYSQNISQSTLDLEEEIDRCYKNNFERVDNLDKNKNETILTVSQSNLNTSITSSCEVLTAELIDDKPVESEVIHPEHKIYKPNSNMLSLKYVLGKFKNKTPTKTEETEINANDPSSPESTKSELKSPTTEKRSALNPRSYSKNLLQRFRNIIGDEHDNNENRSKSPVRSQKLMEDTQSNLTTSEIKVVITSTESSPSTSTIVYAVNSELLSKSVCVQSSMTESQNEKNNLEALSISCDNIPQNEACRPAFDKSTSVVSNTSTNSSQSKSNNNSQQSLNKLPIYMQGSKHLGARIAQSDYVDPSTLVMEKAALKNINVLINKNAVRPDSLFSNSSYVTSSSEGTYLECQNKLVQNTESKETSQGASDESFYEKSFEKIEHVTDEDVFRDSAVYSDQEEDEAKTESKVLKTSKVDSLRQRSLKSLTTHTTTVSEKIAVQTRASKTNVERATSAVTTKNEAVKAKVAPPVPAKPRLSQISSTSTFQTKQTTTKVTKKVEITSSTESVNTKTIKRNTNYKQPVIRSESTPENNDTDVKDNEDKQTVGNRQENNEKQNLKEDAVKYPGNIQIKRLGFERASLDSSTRKLKTETRKTNEIPKVTSKSVFERRMEIESLSKSKPSQLKKPTQVEKPKSITTKVAGYERSMSEGKRDSDVKGDESKKESISPSSSTERANIPPSRSSITDNNDDKSSWVKQVVNKFQ